MSFADYEKVIVKAHNMGALWPERCVSREDIASVEARLGVNFSAQMLDFYTNCGDMTLSDQDVLWLDPNDTEDRNFNLLAVTLEAREAGLPSHLIPFFNVCDDDGNIAYFDFSRMKDGEPLVTIAYFGEEGFVVTSETDCDFGAFLLKTFEKDPAVHPLQIRKLTEDQASGLLQYVKKVDLEYFCKISLPKICLGVVIAFAVFCLLVGIWQKHFFLILGAIFLSAMMSFLLFRFCHAGSHRVRYNDVVQSYGKDKLLRQMTSDKVTVFCYNKNDPESYIVFTEEYLIFVYDNIYPWQSIDCVNIRKYYFPYRRLINTPDQDMYEKLVNAYTLEIHFKSGHARSDLIIFLTSYDLRTFVEYLRTKVPEVYKN